MFNPDPLIDEAIHQQVWGGKLKARNLWRKVGELCAQHNDWARAAIAYTQSGDSMKSQTCWEQWSGHLKGPNCKFTKITKGK